VCLFNVGTNLLLVYVTVKAVGGKVKIIVFFDNVDQTVSSMLSS